MALLIGHRADAQINGPQGLNLPGTWNAYATPGAQPFGGIQAAAGVPDRRCLLQNTLPTSRYSSTINCQAAGGDVMAGTYDFLFTSGPPGGYFNNKWCNGTGGSRTVVTPNTAQSFTWQGAGLDNRITLVNGTYYTTNWKDNGYANTSAIIMTTTSAPVTVTGVSAAIKAPYVSTTQLDGVATTVTATISAALPADQAVYLHYADNAAYTGTATNGGIVLLTGSGTTYTADIPAAFNTFGKTVYYYVFTTNTSATPTYITADVSLRAIRFNNNNTIGGYTYTVGSHVTAPGATVWSSGSSWVSGQVPPTSRAVILNHSITNDVTTNVVSDLVIASGITLTLNQNLSTTAGAGVIIPATTTLVTSGAARFATGAGGDLTNNGTITNPGGRITAGRSLTNNGSITIGSASTAGSLAVGQASTATTLTNNGSLDFLGGVGTVAFFTGAVTVGGTTNITFASVSFIPSVGTSSVDFGVASTVTGTLTIIPSTFVSTNAPFYSNTSRLEYSTVGTAVAPYGRGVEWSSATPGTKGYPDDIRIYGSWLNLSNGAPNVLREMGGNLVLSTPGGAFTSGLLMDAGGDNMTQPLVVKGTVSVLATGTISLSNAAGGDIKVEGGTFNCAGIFNANGRAIFMNGGATSQTLTGPAAGLDVSYLLVNCPTLTLGSNVNVFAPTGGNGVSMSGNINLGGWRLQIRPGANLEVTSALRNITSSGGSGPGAQLLLRRSNAIVSTSGGSLNIASGVKVITGTYGDITPGAINFGGVTTINGTLELQTGGFVDGSGGNGPLYGSTSNLIYNTGFSYDRRSEWDGLITARTPFNVTVTGNTTLNAYDPGASTGNINLPGTLTIDAGSTFNAGSQPDDFVINGDIINAGTLTLSSTVGGDTRLGDDFVNTGTFNSNGRAVWFIGGTQQDVSSTTALSFSYVVMNKSGNKVNLLNDLAIPAGGGGTAISWQTSTSTFDLNGRTLTIGTAGVGAVIGAIPAGSGFAGNSTSTLNLLGTGDIGTLTFVSGSQQLGTLNLDRTASGLVTLGSPLTLNTNLAFTNGMVRLGSNTLALTAAATISGASATKYVETNGTGALARQGLGTGGITTAVDFPVGTATSYNPAALTNTATLDTYSVRVSATPTMAAPVPSQELLRFWNVNEAAAGGSNATLRLYWNGASEENTNFRRNRPLYFTKLTGGMFTKFLTTATQVTGLPYYGELAGITSFSEWSIGNQGVLPVELLFFTGRMDGPDAAFAWQTASEKDNRQFDLERSIDGRKFEAIGTVAGAGTTQVPQSYRFTDRNVARLGATVLYYRLRQLDFSGTVSYSDVVTLTPGKSDGTGPVIFPNLAVSDDFTLQCFAAEAGTVDFTLTDAAGRTVHHSNSAIVAGYNYLPSRTLAGYAGLAPGVYLAHVLLPGQRPAILRLVRQ